MARKNKNAGQPNRAAQMHRHAERRYQNARYKQYEAPRGDTRVLGPGSENLSTGPQYVEGLTHEVVQLQEVAA